MLALLMTLAALAVGADPRSALELPAAPLLGARALRPGPDPVSVAIGLGCHLGVSAAWGALFGAAFGERRSLATLLAGAAFGVVVWAWMAHVALPVLAVPHPVALLPWRTAILAHVIFGVVLAIGVVALAPA